MAARRIHSSLELLAIPFCLASNTGPPSKKRIPAKDVLGVIQGMACTAKREEIEKSRFPFCALLFFLSPLFDKKERRIYRYA